MAGAISKAIRKFYWRFLKRLFIWVCFDFLVGWGPGRISGFHMVTRNKSNVKTAILMLNMGGPQKSSQVEEYLHRIMTDRDMIQLPVQG